MREVKVGIFVLASLIALLYLTFQIKSLESLKDKGYPLYAIVNDASGLAKKSRVKMRGVKIGIIKEMFLTQKGVKLKLLINKKVKIPVGSMVAVAQDNVLGGKYLKIIPSNSDKYYKRGDTISKYISTASMEDVMNNINSAVNDLKVLIQKINNTLDKNTTQNIKTTIANIKDSSIYLKALLKETKEKVPSIMDKTDSLLTNANSLVSTYKK